MDYYKIKYKAYNHGREILLGIYLADSKWHAIELAFRYSCTKYPIRKYYKAYMIW